MKTNKLLKGFFTCAMTAALVFGILHVSAQPAEALQCAPTLFNATFSHVLRTGSICCCIYETPEGHLFPGASWYC